MMLGSGNTPLTPLQESCLCVTTVFASLTLFNNTVHRRLNVDNRDFNVNMMHWKIPNSDQNQCYVQILSLHDHEYFRHLFRHHSIYYLPWAIASVLLTELILFLSFKKLG